MINISRRNVFQILDTGDQTVSTPRWIIDAIINGDIELFTSKPGQFKVGNDVGTVEDYIIKRKDGELNIIPKEQFLKTYTVTNED
jgi:hypothetical protein